MEGKYQSWSVPRGAFSLSKRAIATRAHQLPRFSTALDVCDELLLAHLELGSLAVELALRLGERALVLPQPLGGRNCASEKSFLEGEKNKCTLSKVRGSSCDQN
jgi:hypothetical protein